MANRKTFKVSAFKDYVNNAIALDKISADEKKALCFALEHVLFDTGNYLGFSYVKWAHIPEEDRPDITEIGDMEWDRRYA